jgi:predicted NACHT family NTPase
MLRALRQIVAELRPVTYDDEAAYRFQMAEMHRRLEFVGIPELKERRPITVEDIFINLRTQAGAEEALDVLSPREVRILQLRGGLIDGEIYSAEEIALKFGLTEEEALAIEGDARARLPQPIEFLKVHEAVQRHVKMVILGDPGAGKTMLLHYLTAICAEGRAEAELGLQADGGTGCQSILPVFIPLCEFAAECAERSQDYCLLDYLYTHAREHLLLNLPPDFFEDALEAGRGLVCLDGLDEVWAVRQRKQIADAVRALATRFPRSRYIVTSRIVGYDEAPLDRRDFTHHTILPLSDDDVREFVRKWYAARERDPMQRKQKTDDLIATIEHEPRIRQLTANPLLLTIIALVHRIEAELPHERVKLYDKCVTALVETWEDVKGLTLAEKQRPFYRQRRRLLERLAYELHAGAEEPGQLRMVKVGDL